MMNIYFMIVILLANVIGISIVYQFIKRLEKKEKLIFIATSVAIMYILISIVYWFSGFGINEQVHEVSKNFVLYLFVPVNVILFIPYFASQYMKLKTNKIKIEKFINKLSTLIVILIIVLVMEYFYFRNVQENINDMQNNTVTDVIEETNSKNEMNDIINEEVVKTNKISNEIIANEELVTNVEVTNDIFN